MAHNAPTGCDFGNLKEQFCSITGANEVEAQSLLEACNGDLQLAIGMHMDGAGGATMSAEPQEGATADFVGEDVRAPIPQVREQLVSDQSYTVGLGARRRGARSVFDGFRDFQAETRQAEERARRGQTNTGFKKRTLEDLFRPPIDLMHKGSFYSAKEAGTANNKWLMVNIQNVQEFTCQVLNRDVWSNMVVQDTIKHNFIFWQVYSDSEDGKRFMQFYNIKQWPYVAIIDPQTGEQIVEWTKFDASTLVELINNFISERPGPDGSFSSTPPSKRPKRECSIVEASEDLQIEAAIKASLQQTASQAVSVSSDDDDNEDESESDNLETFTDSDSADDDLDKYINTKKNIITVDSDSCDALKSDSTNNKKAKSKGKKSVNVNVKRKNGDFVEIADCSSNFNDIKIINGNSIQVNEDSCQDNKIETASQESQSSICSWKDFLGSESDSKTKLMIRYPDGKREPLIIPCSSQLKSVVQYISENDIDLDKHELVTNFPRRNLSSMDLTQDLQEAGLHPQETIFVQEKS